MSAARSGLAAFVRRSRGSVLRFACTCPWLPSERAFGAELLRCATTLVRKFPASLNVSASRGGRRLRECGWPPGRSRAGSPRFLNDHPPVVDSPPALRSFARVHAPHASASPTASHTSLRASEGCLSCRDE